MASIYEKSIHTLELPQVLTLLAAQAYSEGAKALALACMPLPHIDDMRRTMGETDSALRLMNLRPAPGFSGLRDITDSVGRAEHGGVLHPLELLRVASFLRTARDTKNYVAGEKREDTVEKTTIDHYFNALSANKYLEERISACIVSEDEIADSASPELSAIRRQMRSAGARVREILHRIITSPSYSKILQENIITLRGDRYVVPVKAEHKGSLNGLVHDVSASGQTVYVEPMQVVEANNELRMLAAKEQKEIERILAELSAEVASFAQSLYDDYHILTQLDFIFARAKYALDTDAQAPELAQDGRVALRRARHPLLPRGTAVPIDVRIGEEFDTLVITGPNTGGKTVALKTVGLLTLMAQCGLHIPAAYDSRVSVFGKIFADIGDEQSISQSLSTFSSHMTNIVGICRELDGNSLALFDELGAGTDPVEGAALAVAIIEHLRARGAKIIATTHYAELKSFALTHPGVENAACEFDLATLRPTYRLLIGVPGKSNAFAIAGRLGLSPEVIEQAKSALKSGDVQFEDVLMRLEQERQAMERQLEEARTLRQAAEADRLTAARQLEALNRDREKEVEAARRKAQSLIAEARAAADTVYEEIGRMRSQAASDAFGQNLIEARAAVGRLLNDAARDNRARPERRSAQNERPLRPGDTVELLSTGNRAVVLEEPEKHTVRLQAGILQITAKLSDVQLIHEKPPAQPEKFSPGVRTQLSSGTRDASTTLDLRGQTADEALIALERFIDSCAMINLPSVTIIHGKGGGVLRAAVHDALKKDRRVATFRLGRYGEGEHGVTIAEFR